LIPVTLQPNVSVSPQGGSGNYKVCLFYGYTLFNSNMWMLCRSFFLIQCFVDVTGKHTNRIGRSDRLMTVTIKPVTKLGH